MDWLTKQTIFILTVRTINATMLIELFIKHIFSKYGVSTYVISDWRIEFILKFFRSLAEALNIKLYFISDYYLEVNNQTKCINQTLEQFLRIYCNYQQLDWIQLLLLVELAYNNSLLLTTNVSLFYTNKRYYPRLQLQVDYSPVVKEINIFVVNSEKVHLELRRSIEET